MMRAAMVLVIVLLPLRAWATDPTLPLATFTPNIAPALRTPCPNAGVCNTTAEVTAALAAAQCGDWLLLNHSNTFTAPSSGWTLPILAGTCVGSGTGVLAISGSSGVHAISGSSGVAATTATGGDNYLVITSDNYALLPPSLTTVSGRVNVSDKANMPTIIGTGANIQASILGDAGVHHVQIRGLNFTAPSVNGTGACANVSVCAFVQIEPTGGNVPSTVHHIAIDQNYMTADPTLGATQGIQIAGNNIATRNNRILNIFDPISSNETHGILHHGGQYFTTTGNEVCAQSIALWFGESLVAFWSGGSYGVGSPIGVSDVTLRWNYAHKLCIPNTAHAMEKNLLEGKYWNRALVDSNVFDTTYQAGQLQCISLVSARGSQSFSGDITFTNNWIRNCPAGLTITLRPSESMSISGAVSDGGTGCSGGPCVKLTTSGPCDCTTGDMAEVWNVGGVTEANGKWLPITRVDSTHIVLPVAWGGHVYTSGGSIQFWFQGTPVQRLLVKNNLWTNIAGTTYSVGGQPFAIINTNPTIVPAVGTDASISTTGDWKPNDIQIKHNTMINPVAANLLSMAFNVTEANTRPHTANTDWQGDRFVVQDNIFHLTDGAACCYSVSYFDQSASDAQVYGTAALNHVSNPSTRTFDHNIGYEWTISDEATKYSGTDTWTLLTGTGCSVVLFTSCSTDTIAAAALQAGSPGHATASDGTDIGVNTTTLANALSGVTP